MPHTGARGCRRRNRLRLSRWPCPRYLRCALRQLATQPHPRAPRAGCGARCRWLCACDRQGRHRHRHERSRCHQHGHGHRDGVHGLRPARRHHRSGSHRCAGQRCVPGVGHDGHHASHRETQLPRQGGGRYPRDHRPGISHRFDRTSGPRGHRHPEQPRARVRRCVQLSRRGQAPVVQAHVQGQQQAGEAGGARNREGEASRHIRGRRCHRLGRDGRAHAACRVDADSRRDDAHRQGGLSRGQPAQPGDAGNVRAPGGKRGDARKRPRACRGHALREPFDGRRAGIRAARARDTHRHRSRRDRQEPPRRHPHRGRREDGADRSH